MYVLQTLSKFILSEFPMLSESSVKATFSDVSWERISRLHMQMPTVAFPFQCCESIVELFVGRTEMGLWDPSPLDTALQKSVGSGNS